LPLDPGEEHLQRRAIRHVARQHLVGQRQTVRGDHQSDRHLAQIQHVRLHDTATHDTRAFDDAPILVRLAVFLRLGLSQKHDSESSRANLMLGIG
jgi:hypothetical protein